jgi:lipid-A-disaccharide synthase-like uncharacterized protein
MARVEDVRHEIDAATADLDPMPHLRNLDYPRRSGTEGEGKAATYIAQQLKQFGFEPAVHEFQYPKPKLRSRILPPMVMLLWLALSLANIRFWNSNLIVSLVVLMVPSALILAILNFGRLMRYFSRRRIMRLKKVEEQSMDGTLDPDQVITSRNVIAEIGPEDAEQQILFTAHFDSISSTIPTRLMMISMLIGFVGALVYSVLYLVNMIVDGNFIAANLPAYAVFASILAVLLGIVFLSRSLRSNKSHGIIDDGTGVAILLELSKLVKARPIPGYKFIFGFYGSEESGLIGSTYDYMKREIDKDRLRVISVDMIGEKPPLAYVKKIALIRGAIMDPTLNEQIVSIAESLDIEIEGKNFPYSGSDFAPFMLLGGCRANWIINRSRLIHSKNDHLGNVNEILVNDAMKLIAGYLLQLEA